MNYKELAQAYRTLGATGTCDLVRECLDLGQQGKAGGIKASDFSLRELAEAIVPDGREWVRNLDPRNSSPVLESSDGVDVTAFANITGQLLISEVMAGYQAEDFVATKLFRTVPTRLDGERVPGVAGLGDKEEPVHPGMPYPSVGFGEDYIDLPPAQKHGFIVPVTREAIFFDRTGLVLEKAREVGESAGIAKEKRCLSVLIGATNNYSWRGTTYNTYQSATPWVNELSGATYDLKDWTQVDAVESLFAEMLDPNTGEPILMRGQTILATPAKSATLSRILTATEVRHSTDSAAIQTISSNPISGYTALTSRLLYRRLQAELGVTADQAKATYFVGDFAKAFRYSENWPITVSQAPSNSEAEFTQDIVLRYKVSERGVAVATDPRYVVRVKGHA